LIRVTYALRAPVACGLKTNCNVHDVPGMTGVPQYMPVKTPPEKSPGFAPENEDERPAVSIPTGAAVLLVKVTVSGAEVVKILVAGKFRTVVDTVKPDDTVRWTLRSGGVCGCTGWNGEVGVTRS
jgi:hypothetical protein